MSSTLRKRLAYVLSIFCMSVLLPTFPVRAESNTATVQVYKSALCGCCGKWVAHMRTAGFNMQVHEVQDVSVERKRLGMPDHLGSCHTAVVEGYVLEGHVPSADVVALLKQRPKALGIAVPGMPQGSPGMEGSRTASFDTLLVGTNGSTRVFAKH